MAVRNRAHTPNSERAIDAATKCTKDGRKLDNEQRMPGVRLELSDVPERPRLIGQPSSRTGENPPYGMIRRIVETSASFEARSALRSYPTDPRRP